ncbi:MAG TPA: MFS transporter [Vitreimonas sp.]|nr:MFS transporter [Vitreimonas sp.]
MQKNITLFYIVRALFLPFFWLPVLYLYLTEVKGLNAAETALILSLQEFLLIFLEIPTGVIADKISRKFSISLGYILTALPFLFLPFVNSVWVIGIIFAIKAIGKALVSGADTSLLYDTLVDLNRTSEYKRIMNLSRSLMMAGVAFSIVTGGLIAEYNIELTLVLPFPLMVIGALAASLMTEPSISQKGKTLQESNYLNHTWQAAKYMWQHQQLLMVVLIFAVTEATALNMKWYYTPVFDALNFDLAAIGGITAAFYIAKSLLAAVSSCLLKDELNHTYLIAFSALTSLSLIISGVLFVPWVVVVALLGVILFTECLLSIAEEEIHNQVSSHNRATILSMVNLTSSVVATITLNGFGLITLTRPISAGLAFLAVTFILSAATAIFYKGFRQ